MVKSEKAKANDATYHRNTYKNLDEAGKNVLRERRRNNKRQQRAIEALGKAAAKESVKATKDSLKVAMILAKFSVKATRNRNKCRSWRLNKKASKAAIALAALANVRVLRNRKIKNYSELVQVSEVIVPGQGKGVQADKEIPPATFICEYGGELISDYQVMEQKLASGNDKILQVRRKQIWWDGSSSQTLGPKLNHACNCVSNCEITWHRDVPYICSKASKQGHIKNGDHLTIDYGYGKEGHFDNDIDLKWYVEYLRAHKCKKD